MAQTKRQIEAALAAAGSRPRHRFGQNFMIDANLVRLIADAGRIEPGDHVLEVGPGTGTLTEELLARVGESGRVTAVEIDRDLAASLRARFADEQRFSLIEGDAMAGKHGLNPDLSAVVASGGTTRLVANLPYNIASPLVVELLLAGVKTLAFTVQKEVAERLRAGPPEGKAYGPLSVAVQTLAEVEVLRTIPPGAFWPPPSIDSALVRLVARPDRPQSGIARDFARFVTAVFSMRRKTLRRALAAAVSDPDAALASAGLDGTHRPEQIEPAALWRLFVAVDPGDHLHGSHRRPRGSRLPHPRGLQVGDELPDPVE